MAVTLIKEIGAGRDGSETNAGVKNYKRIFRVTTNNAFDNAKTVRAALMLFAGATPADPFPGDASAWPIRYSETQLHEKFIWIGEINYSNENTNPLNEAAVLSTGGQMFQRVMLFDANGDAVINTAGFPFLDPPVEIEDARGTIEFSKNVAVPPSWLYSLNRTVNETQFSIWGGAVVVAAETAKLREPVKITGAHTRNGVTYYTVAGTIDVDLDGWKAKPLNAGWDEVDPNDATKRRRIVCDEGTEPQQPWPLDASGFALRPPTPTTIINLEFVRYLPADWSALTALLV